MMIMVWSMAKHMRMLPLGMLPTLALGWAGGAGSLGIDGEHGHVHVHVIFHVNQHWCFVSSICACTIAMPRKWGLFTCRRLGVGDLFTLAR